MTPVYPSWGLAFFVGGRIAGEYQGNGAGHQRGRRAQCGAAVAGQCAVFPTGVARGDNRAGVGLDCGGIRGGL